MTLEEFSQASSASAQWEAPLRALWHDAAGNWQAAHALVQDDPSADAAWVHAYLHRKEGDSANAGYWYARAGKEVSESNLDAEWREIARALLSLQS